MSLSDAGRCGRNAERETAAYALTYDCGWEVDRGVNPVVNEVPAGIQHMILSSGRCSVPEPIDPFAAAGVRDLTVGSVELKAAIPPDVAALGSAYAYRQTIGRM